MDVDLGYWTRWQVAVCGLILAVPAAGAAAAIWRSRPAPVRSSDLWLPCWRRVHPVWLLLYRVLVLVPMLYLLYCMLLARGISAFYFYTQWTFALVIIYFLIATLISAHGCWIYSKGHSSEIESAKRLLEKDFEENLPATLTFKTNTNRNITKLPNYHEEIEVDQTAGFLGYTMQIIYQTCAGAVMLTDIVFWGVLLPFSSSDYFKLSLVKGCVHSLNAVFLILDTSLNSLQFPLFRMAYFVLWSSIYVIFQWILHACGISWWPYPFLELANPWAPLWYFCMALVHIPCYGIYVLIVKAKDSIVQKTSTSYTSPL
ncbi:Uncharacterized protein M6B38_221965 [Iris pallida]|uniref:Uncharacterized protein n=1 Tax=Iris pallida TaxID=29817 RepID=A0AAX6DWQ2_IRIPA|nr:Uncharacterized protein M6B38_221965 [Iris pallida]